MLKGKISHYLTNAYSFPNPRSFVILNRTTEILDTLNLNMTCQLNLKDKYLFQLVIQLSYKFLQTKKKPFVRKTIALFAIGYD